MMMGGPIGSPAAAPAQGGGLWGRIKTELHKPGMAAALFRSGVATLNGGLGAGLAAGANYMDEQKGIAAKAAQQQFTNDLATRGITLDELRAQQANDLGWAGAANQAAGIKETGRHNRAGEGIDANGQRIQLYGIDTGAAVQRRGQDVSLVTNQQDNDQSDRNSQRGYDASIYGNNLTYMAQTGPAGIGSKGGGAYVETKSKVPGKPAKNGWFSDTPATPDLETTTRVPMLPPAATAAAAAPSSAVSALKANPNLRGQFEAKYGPGSAAQYLGGR